jgi:hypothetical protein
MKLVMMKHVQKILISIILVIIAGCSGSKLPPDLPKLFPCKITVQQDGVPLADAKVFLSPTDGSQWNASGNTNTQGVVELWTHGSYRGVSEGKFKVLISKQEIVNPSPTTSSDLNQKIEEPKVYNLVEEIYSETEKTPLSIDVSSNQSEFTLDAGKSVRKLIPACR